MAEINDFRGTKVGNLVVECVEMLDDDTCILSFETIDDEEDENVVDDIQVEYWLDEDSWHFNVSYFEKESGDFLDMEAANLTEDDKNWCKEIIGEYLKQITTD